MGMWGPIKYALNSSIGATNFEALDTTIGKRSQAASTISTASLFAWVKQIYNSVESVKASCETISNNAARGAVKNVQRGSVSIGMAAATPITISSVVTAKTFINIVQAYDANTPSGTKAFVSLTGSTTLTCYSGTSFSNDGMGAAVIRWELVEFF